MTAAQIHAAATERETRLAAIVAKYDLRPVRQSPFLTATARDLAVALDKLERKCAA